MAHTSSTLPGEWDETTTIEGYTTPRHAAGYVAWEALTHAEEWTPDLAILVGLPAPEGLSGEDIWQVLFETITTAGELGYLYGKLEGGLPPFSLPWEGGKLTSASMARAMIALMGWKILDPEPEADPPAS